MLTPAEQGQYAARRDNALMALDADIARSFCRLTSVLFIHRTLFAAELFRASNRLIAHQSMSTDGGCLANYSTPLGLTDDEYAEAHRYIYQVAGFDPQAIIRTLPYGNHAVRDFNIYISMMVRVHGALYGRRV